MTSDNAGPADETELQSENEVRGRWQSKSGGARVRFPPPLVFVASILLGVILQRVVRPLAIPGGPPIRVAVGAVLIAAGLCLIVSALVLFRRTGQDPKPWQPSPELVFKGPYRFTRNPMYVAMTLFTVGIGTAINNLWVLLLGAISLLTVHFIAVLPEERYLTEKFGESYRNYLSQVRRYL